MASKKRGRPPTTGDRLTLRISHELLARVEAGARANGVDVSTFTRDALLAHLGAGAAELEAWRLGRQAGIAEAIAAIRPLGDE